MARRHEAAEPLDAIAMTLSFEFEKSFLEAFPIDSAARRFGDAREVASRITHEGVRLMPNMDHTAMMGDPPRLITGPLRKLGYRAGWDERTYPSPLENFEFYLITSRLPPDSPIRHEGWFDYVAAVFSIDDPAYDYFIGQGNGNPFLHHMTMGIVPPERGHESDLEYAYRLVPYMIDVRRRIQQGTGEQPSQLVMSLPHDVFINDEFRHRVPELMHGLDGGPYVIESMQGGGFLIQFFVLGGARIEVACRHRTVQAFNPRSTERFTREEISIHRDLVEKPIARIAP
jgi:hypothetical protein